MVNALELLKSYQSADLARQAQQQQMEAQQQTLPLDLQSKRLGISKGQLDLDTAIRQRNALAGLSGAGGAGGIGNALLAVNPSLAAQFMGLERQDRAEKANEGYRNEQLRLKRLEVDPFGMLMGGGQVGGGAGGTPQAPGMPPPGAGQVGQPQGAPMGGTGGGNAQILQKLPAPMAQQVKALAEGRMAFPSGFALKSPYWQKMISLVSEYDPSFDAINYNARAKTRSDMSSGVGARNLTAINTAIGHLDSLDKAATALGNSDYPALNTAFNTIAPAIGGTETAGKLRTFQQAKEAVANELMRVFRGTGASTADTAKWAETINQSDSPTALKSSVKSAVDLLKSRIEALDEQYKRGMGTAADVKTFLNPKSLKTLERLGGEEKGLAPEIEALVKKYGG